MHALPYTMGDEFKNGVLLKSGLTQKNKSIQYHTLKKESFIHNTIYFYANKVLI